MAGQVGDRDGNQLNPSRLRTVVDTASHPFAAGLREAGAATSASRRRRTALNIVVGMQVAIAASLGFVSMLLIRSMANVYEVDLGFQPGQSFVFRVQLPPDEYRIAAE